jgi:single-stranded-DNA-specific exonuclease
MLLAAPSRRWIFPAPADEARVDRLCRELRLPGALCRLLVARGYGEPESVREFLRPHAGQVHPPLMMAGMPEAVERILRAVRQGETILAHGDYDVDGICSTALFVRALRMMGARAVPFVPHRLQDGYDLSDAGIRAAQKLGATLILTGDCGIVAHEAIERARAAGIDVVVTDHHTPGPTLPPAAAVVNPNRADCPYPDKGLAGVGVAFKLCQAVAGALGFPPERLNAFLDLVAVATVADLAPLTGENRALVRWGLKVLPQTPNPGLRALLQATGLGGRNEITATQVGFVLAPRINAVGRRGEAMHCVALLTTDDEREAERIAQQLEEDNRWRQAEEAGTVKQALELLERGFDPARDWGVVLADERWHPGVIGIVASRLVERIHRPTVLIALGAGEGKGSARSIPGFHLNEAMRAQLERGKATRQAGQRSSRLAALTPRERDVLRGIVQGMTNKAIAGRLQISTRTVESHRESLMLKLCVRHVAALTRLALEEGLSED